MGLLPSFFSWHLQNVFLELSCGTLRMTSNDHDQTLQTVGVYSVLLLTRHEGCCVESIWSHGIFFSDFTAWYRKAGGWKLTQLAGCRAWPPPQTLAGPLFSASPPSSFRTLGLDLELRRVSCHGHQGSPRNELV